MWCKACSILQNDNQYKKKLICGGGKTAEKNKQNSVFLSQQCGVSILKFISQKYHE